MIKRYELNCYKIKVEMTAGDPTRYVFVGIPHSDNYDILTQDSIDEHFVEAVNEFIKSKNKGKLYIEWDDNET